MATTVSTRRFQTDSPDLLRFAMRLDATLTGLAGLAIAALGSPVATLSGLPTEAAYILGAALVLYGVLVYRLADVRALRGAGLGVIIANLMCTVAAVLVVVEGVWPLTTLGVALLLAMGVYTAGFAVLQYFGVRRLA